MDIIITIGDALLLKYIATLQIIKYTLRKIQSTPSYTKEKASEHLKRLQLPEQVKLNLLAEFSHRSSCLSNSQVRKCK